MIAKQKLYTETWLGRRRYLPNIRSDNWGLQSFAERCALNTPIQGTAADILKLAIVRILEGLPSRPWLRPILQIHDELTFFDRGTLIASGFIAGGALMGVVSAILKFYDVDWRMAEWAASNEAEWTGLLMYLVLIGYFAWHTLRARKEE